jgi:hypothetical protein
MQREYIEPGVLTVFTSAQSSVLRLRIDVRERPPVNNCENVS